MNRQLHRVVFNRHRAALMVVAEHAATSGGGAARGSRRRPARGCPVEPYTAPRYRALFGALLMVFSALGPGSPAFAQIVADPSAPSGQQAHVHSAGNGVPLVQIAKPSAAGVSRNVYSQFDVDARGAILNNARTDALTQLGGWVQGNPALAAGSARVILNEVNAVDPSRLNGFIEVAGKRAEVVVANPAGITCDGCGFINASRATLTTGTPQFDGGALTGYRVAGGTVAIEGAGLDAGGGHAAIIAHAAAVNAGIWANHVHVEVGVGTADAATLALAADPDADATPRFALDVAALGGMYANSITLIGSGAGVGVRSAGELGAAAGELQVTADGRLEHSGSIAAQRTTLAADELINRGLIDGDTTRIDAGTLANLGGGRIYGEQVVVAADTLYNLGEDGVAPVIAARQRLDIGATDIVNAADAILLSGADMAIGGRLGESGQAEGRADSLLNSSATIEALGTLRIEAEQLDNLDARFDTRLVEIEREHVHEYQRYSSSQRYSADQVSIKLGQPNSEQWVLYLHTPSGSSEHWYHYDYVRRVLETELLDSRPADILAGGDMALNAGTLVNDKSRIVAGAELAIAADSVLNLDAAGQRIETASGTATRYYRIKRSQGGYAQPQGIETSSYKPAPIVAEYALASAVQAGGQPVAGSGASAAAQVPQLPASALYQLRPEATAGYLVETDPRFASYGQWLSSDHMLARLGLDPSDTHKRLGDGYFEQQLVRDQLMRQTGHSLLAGYEDGQAQYRALLDAGVTVAQAWNLVPGVALTAEQVAQLTSDIVWLVEQTVLLPDGSATQVLVPQVYARLRTGDLDGAGSLVAGRTLQVAAEGLLVNQGRLSAQQTLHAQAGEWLNLGGQVLGSEVSLRAQGDLVMAGGHLEAQQALALEAGRDLSLGAATYASVAEGGPRGGVARAATVYVGGGEGGSLAMRAGRDLQLAAVDIANEGSGPTRLDAGRHLVLDTVSEWREEVLIDPGSVRREVETRDVGSSIRAAGDIELVAGGQFIARAAQLDADGTLTLAAQGAYIGAGEARSAVQGRLSNAVSGRVVELHNESIRALGTQWSGQTVTLGAADDLTLAGARIDARENLTLAAGGDLVLGSAQEGDSSDWRRNDGRNWRNETRSREVVSTLSAGGDLTLLAGNDLVARGTQASAGGSLSAQAGRDLVLDAAEETYELDAASYKRSSGTFGSKKRSTREIAFERTVSGAQLSAASIELSAGRDLSATAATLEAEHAVHLEAGRDLALLAGQDSAYHFSERNKKGDFGRRSMRSDEATEIIHQGVRIEAGGDVTLASGADQTYQVASLVSGGDLSLEAGGDIVFEAVKDFAQEARHKSSSDWAWRSAKGEGFSAETVRLSELAAPGELAIQAAGQIRIDVPHISRQTVSQTIDQLVEQQPQLVWLKEMDARGDIDWRRVKEQHDRFKYSDSGMGAGLAVVVAIVVTVMTWGAASAAVGSAAGAGAGTGTAMAAAGGGVAAGWANVAATAAITSMASNAVINTINSGGDLGEALKLTFSDTALKGYVTAALAAGITSGVIDKAFAGETNPVTGATAGHNLNTLSGVGNFAAHQASRAVVSAALDAAINGGSFEETLAAALTSAAVHTVSAAAFNQVGNLGLDNGSIEKIAVKALVGGLISQAATGDFATGALAAGANEALVEDLAGLVDHDPQLLGMASQLVGAVSAGLTGGDARLAADIAGYSTQYNRQLHLSEKQLAQELAAQSDGRWTVEQIEDALRWADNLERGETYTHGLTARIEGATTEDIYDAARSYVSNGFLIQDLSAIPRPNDELMAFIQQSTGDTYAWNPAIFPRTPVDPNAGMAWTSNGYVPIRDGSGTQATYATYWADGQGFSLPVVNCPSVVCTNGAAIAWASTDPADQAALRAYEAAVGRQTIDDMAKLATIASVLTPIGAGRLGLGTLYTGFVTGAGFDAAGQYIQRGEVRPVQTLVAGVTGATGLRVATRGNLWIPATGSTVAAANTSFNNFYYGEDTNVYVAAGLGAVFSVAAPPVGSFVSNTTNRLLGNPMMYIPASGPVQPMRMYPNADFWATVPGQAGSAAAYTVGSLPSLIPLDSGKPGAKP